jgi:hypothetical protein
MTIQKIFEYFDEKIELPVDVSEVEQQLLKHADAHTVVYHFVELNKDKLRAFVHISQLEDEADAKKTANVYLCENLEEWERLAAVKELLHIIDLGEYTAESRQAVSSLFTAMALHKVTDVFVHPSENDANSVANDKRRIFSAINILVPKRCRELLRTACIDGKLNEDTAAELAGVPITFMKYILDPGFEKTIKDVHEQGD